MEQLKIFKVPEGKIKDYVDGKLRNDTPEEYVRQNVEKRLVNEHKYPKDLIRVEYTVKLGTKKKRADLVIFPEGTDANEQIQDNIHIIIECKKESVASTDKKEGVDQLKSYMAASPNCEWGMWTNGKEKEVYRKVLVTDAANRQKVVFEDYIDIPSFGKDVSEVNRPTRESLKKAVEDNLLFAFKKCHNHIYAMEGMQKQPAFFELLKVIFCKIQDEKNILGDIEFYATSQERANPDGQLTVKKRISRIFDQVKKKHNKIFEKNDAIDLNPRTLAYVVGELQKYSLLETNIDVKGKAYEEIVGANLRGDRGEFFTPRNIMHMTVKMLNPRIGEKVLDSSCGTGGFLVNAMNHVIEQIEAQAEQRFRRPKKDWTDHEKQTVQGLIEEVAQNNFYGFDINPDLVKATKMNMVMNNDGSGNILRANSLLPPHEWSEEFKKALAVNFDLDWKEIRTWRDIALFDVIVTNPPFGSKIPIKDSTILNQFNIAEGSKSVPPEQLFVERCVQLLRPGGRLGIVLPDSILGAPGLVHIRKWLIENTRIIASVDLHVDTFQPRNGTQTSVLIVQKKTEEELAEPLHNYNIFMAIVDKVGHDKRGVTVYERDKDGEIIYQEVEKEDIDGTRFIDLEPSIADQSVHVPGVFAEWKKQEGITW